MIIYPAIDLYDGKAVRLYKGDYEQMTVYSENPPEIAEAFAKAGATHMHVVDLEGAKSGMTPNFDTIMAIRKAAPDMFIEVGGGIRDEDTIEKYLRAGIGRVILGTAAVQDQGMLNRAVRNWGRKIAVGIDVRDGYVAVKGWTELSQYTLEDFAREVQSYGVSTLICTDISRDGAMRGTNRLLYKELSETLNVNVIASGGVSTLEDIQALAGFGIHGAIIGKAYYTGAIDLAEAVKTAEGR
jgi:phosphoribosylformimino-5-aminoimidazole carboxamide ribotide isomerase